MNMRPPPALVAVPLNDRRRVANFFTTIPVHDDFVTYTVDIIDPDISGRNKIQSVEI